jgi:NAD(P)-dependent dehydrogenase (short-subunit alcohol dehydrogenase family)
MLCQRWLTSSLSHSLIITAPHRYLYNNADQQVNQQLANKVCVITGGTRGIGKAISLAFAREGASVCVIGRSFDASNEVAMGLPCGPSCNDRRQQHMAIGLDVTSEAAAIKKSLNQVIKLIFIYKSIYFFILFL